MRNEPILLYKIKQTFAGTPVADLAAEVRRAVADSLRNTTLPAGSRIAVTAGSRGIRNIVTILATIVQELKARGYAPFLVAAMGSHGRGEAEGQAEVLRSLGIVEEAVGAPVSCSDQVVEIGLSDEQWGIGGLPVYLAKEAWEADGILVVNRIKPHTSFRGDYESGLLKMMAVGLGRAKGADCVHSLGAHNMARAIPSIARVILEKARVIGGIAIVENAEDETALVEGMPACEMFDREKALLRQAKAMMPSLPVSEIDLCLVGEMGKNFSGTGMDTNIIGRMRIQGIPEPESPRIKYLAVLGLSKESHGNANGIGLADFTTEAVVSQIDQKATYLNCLTTGFVMRAFIPMTFANDRELLDGAIKALKAHDLSALRLVYIKNTLHIEECWVSEPILRELGNDSSITCIDGPIPLTFDEKGKLLIPSS